jgi:short-subunit dehydrogenase
MKRELRNAVVVITGASSGIGRATARAFAEEGASLVLAARNELPLRALASECEAMDAAVLVVPTDVSDERAVELLARVALDRFGRIDVWVNNAAVMLYGRFEDTPPEAFRRVFETNVFGYANGARAALRAFREQGTGVLINNASAYAAVGAPYLSSYVASKFAVRGLSDSLRQEVQGEDIDVVTVLPASVDTPLFQHAANFTGRAIQPLKPIYRPEQVARTIVRCARRPRREAYVGTAGRTMGALRSLAPALFEKMNARLVEEENFGAEAVAPSEGNLREPQAPASTTGGWRDGNESNGRAGKLALAGLLISAPASLGWWAWRRWRRTRLEGYWKTLREAFA